MDKKKYIDVLSTQAEKNNRPQELALSDLLDFAIELFSIEAFKGDRKGHEQYMADVINKNPDYAGLVMLWLDDVAKAMDRGEWLDAFGILYEEMYLSRGKASSTGQFFTPPSISDFMAKVIQTGEENGTVNDCACGSGRLLLARYMEKSRTDHSVGRRFRYIAQDSDPVACKMCALNLMAHGMYGEVICQNTLSMSVPSVVYYINEVKYPINTPYCSIRAVHNEKA